MSDIIKSLLVNNARKSMLENIDGIDDIDFLKKELKGHLRKEFDLQQKNKELENINDKLSSALNSTEQRVDKAIEYMKFIKMNKTDKYIPIKDYDEYQRLLSILKGED